MNKQELVAMLSERCQMPKTVVEDLLTAFQYTVIEQVNKGEEVKLIGLGTFLKYKRKARTYRNPQNGVEVKAPASFAVKFKCHETFKKQINKKLK